MEEIRKRFKSFLVLSTVVVVVLIVLVVYLKTELLKTETYRHQLIAFCAAVDHADIPGTDVYVMKDPHQLLPLNSKERSIVFVVFKKDESERRLYSVYSDGRVICTGRNSDGMPFRVDENWGKDPRFSKIGKK